MLPALRLAFLVLVTKDEIRGEKFFHDGEVNWLEQIRTLTQENVWLRQLNFWM